jgi:hypothetical protein
MGNHFHKLKKIFIETRVKGKTIPFDMSMSDIIRMAEQEKNFYRYNETTFFCCYKTVFKEKPSILILFSIKLPGSPSGSSVASQYLISLIETIEKNFAPIADYYLEKEVDSKKSTIGLLRFIREIKDTDKF